MARLGVREEENLIVLKYVSGLTPYIQQEIKFLTIDTLTDAFHYFIKLERKLKVKYIFQKNRLVDLSRRNLGQILAPTSQND